MRLSRNASHKNRRLGEIVPIGLRQGSRLPVNMGSESVMPGKFGQSFCHVATFGYYNTLNDFNDLLCTFVQAKKHFRAGCRAKHKMNTVQSAVIRCAASTWT